MGIAEFMDDSAALFASVDSKDGLETCAKVMIGMGLTAFFFLHVVKLSAPYGRYSEGASAIYGFKMPGKLAWVLQELPAFAFPVYFIFTPGREIPVQAKVLLALFLLHYANRTFVFPFLITGGKPTPVVVFLLAFVFCLVNGIMQGRYLVEYATYDADKFMGTEFSLQFICGAVLFLLGMAINMHSDSVLRNLRKPGDKGYYIPRGGMFEYVSGANFFGEIVEWSGFAIASGSIIGWAFAIFTACNIGPRAIQHHQWYLNKFDDYDKLGRKAVIPFLL
jgi:3-oxo-5-alpha-steroid 4-dehydrogenase 1